MEETEGGPALPGFVSEWTDPMRGRRTAGSSTGVYATKGAVARQARRRRPERTRRKELLIRPRVPAPPSAGRGRARLGSARLGSARLGSARLGSARLGSAYNMLLEPLAKSRHQVRRKCHYRAGGRDPLRLRHAAQAAPRPSSPHFPRPKFPPPETAPKHMKTCVGYIWKKLLSNLFVRYNAEVSSPWSSSTSL